MYVGEYAVTQDYGVNGHLSAALGEAVFMLGMENNSDVCIMNSYAPIFVNENNYNWRPDMIRFNSYTSYGTPSYYVQQLFPNNVGKQNVKWTETGNSLLETGTLGLSTWSTSATFDNVKVTDGEGQVIFSDDFSSQKAEWASQGGTWTTSGGVLRQTNTSMQGQLYVCNISHGARYTYEVEATKNSGAEGFLIAFNYNDGQNYCWWNLGGWGNTKHAVEVCTGGTKTTVASVNGALVTGHTYRIKVVVDGGHVQCFLDDVLMHDFTLSSSRNVYVSSNIDDEAGILYVKLVNPSAKSQEVTLNLLHASATGGSAVVLTSENGTDENNLENPNNVVPREQALDVQGNQFTYTVPAYSVNILRLNVEDVELVAEEQPELPDPLLQYSFEAGQPADDGGTYAGQLCGGASIVSMNDGNKVLYTGDAGEEGYLDLGADMARQALAGLDGDYTLSIDMAFPGTGNLASYCWAYGFARGEEQYVGLVNSPNNVNWYYTIKDEGSTDVHYAGGFSYGKWHNVTYVQSGSMGNLYVDGRLAGTQVVAQRPADIAAQLTEAYIGRSPFTADALMEFLEEVQLSARYGRIARGNGGRHAGGLAMGA